MADINGVVLFRGHRPKEEIPPHLMERSIAEPFGLADNCLLFGEDGALVHMRGPRSRIDNVEFHPGGGYTVFDDPPSFSDRPDEDSTKAFGAVGPRQKRLFHRLAFLPEARRRRRVAANAPGLAPARVEPPAAT